MCALGGSCKGWRPGLRSAVAAPVRCRASPEHKRDAGADQIAGFGATPWPDGLPLALLIRQRHVLHFGASPSRGPSRERRTEHKRTFFVFTTIVCALCCVSTSLRMLDLRYEKSVLWL